MNLNEIKKDILSTGVMLLDMGLVARTWGNLSARIDSNHFLITPSGRNYRDLRGDELVIVNISDGASWGDGKPSSEKGVHSAVYREYPDVNFVIHTHQPEASAVSALRFPGGDFTAPGGISVAKAEYGLSGSEELAENIAAVLRRGKQRRVLMSHHGVLSMGSCSRDVIQSLSVLEMEIHYALSGAAEKKTAPGKSSAETLFGYVPGLRGYQLPAGIADFMNSERHGKTIRYFDSASGEHVPSNKVGTAVKTLHRSVYDFRPDVNAITHSMSSAVVAYSLLGEALGSYIDDFAQINGPEMNCVLDTVEDILEGLGENHGVMIRNHGALCCGSTKEDADALAFVAEKNAYVPLIAPFFEGSEAELIPEDTCKLMRSFYLEKYAKLY